MTVSGPVQGVVDGAAGWSGWVVFDYAKKMELAFRLPAVALRRWPQAADVLEGRHILTYPHIAISSYCYTRICTRTVLRHGCAFGFGEDRVVGGDVGEGDGRTVLYEGGIAGWVRASSNVIINFAICVYAYVCICAFVLVGAVPRFGQQRAGTRPAPTGF